MVIEKESFGIGYKWTREYLFHNQFADIDQVASLNQNCVSFWVSKWTILLIISINFSLI